MVSAVIYEQVHILRDKDIHARSHLLPLDWEVWSVGRIQKSVTWEMSWSCTNGFLFQPFFQKGVMLSTGRGLRLLRIQQAEGAPHRDP